MKSNQRSAAWPFLLVLLGLFALSITAPRAWNRQRGEFSPQSKRTAEVSEIPEKLVASQPSITTASDGSWIFSSESLSPVVVKPIKAFSHRVIDPIVEFARRPVELRVLTEQYLQPFEPNEPVMSGPARIWVRPQALVEALDRLATEQRTAIWANQILQLLDELSQGSERPAAAVLADLNAAIEPERLPQISNPSLKAEVKRVCYALQRRLEIWQEVDQWANDAQAKTETVSIATASGNLSQPLGEIERLTASLDVGDAWREYLLVEQLRTLDHDAVDGEARRRKLAQEVLARLETHRLSAKQRKFVANEPIVKLIQELQQIAAEPVSAAQIVSHLEQYEQTQLPSDARTLADDYRSLAWSADTSVSTAKDRLDLYYRNANVRVSIASAFVNRFVPQPMAVNMRVNDTIQGVPVEGRSTTFSEVSVRTIPDPRRLRLGLEASGIVASDTTSAAGPATFYNKAESSFLVRKLVLLSPNGMRVWPSVANADSYYTDLTDVETSFDIVPLVGPLVRNIARSQHAEAQVDARYEVESKVAARARRQFDDEVGPRLQQMATKVDREVLEPLRRLGLDPAVLDMQTTDERMIVRSRLAGTQQLGAHTPRPRAMSDSVASLQVHQSAINNMLSALDLEGREFTVPELYLWMGRKLGRTLQPPQDVPEDVIVQFADKDAVRILAREGQVELAIAIEKLAHGRKHWRDFIVKTVYEPDPTTLEGKFVRTGGIFLEGKSLQGRVEFVLRSIFSKALSTDRPWQIVPAKFAGDKRMADLEIAQFVVEDGWIGLAYAPRRTPVETARRPR